jgi:hypothetical protein
MNFAILAQMTPGQPVNPAAPELPDIQDIISPEALPSYWLIIASILGGLIFVGGLIWLTVYFLRQDSRRSHQIPAGRLALKKLDELERDADSLAANVFSLKVSDILKDYLQARFHDSFRYETSEEFLNRMGAGMSNPLPQRLRTGVAGFVGLCDELKFARPANADINKLPLLEQARQIIREPTSETTHADPAAHS